MSRTSEPLARTAPVPERLWRIWAKWSKTGTSAPAEGETYHPLICHLLDVATVARHLWGSALPPATRERLMRHLGLSDEAAAGAWIAFFTGLHDIGKACPGFQDQLSNTSAGATIRRWMYEAGLSFTDAKWVPHGQVSARVLGMRGTMLVDLDIGEELAGQIAALVGGHHGVFPRRGDVLDLKGRQQVGSGNWDTVRAELVVALRAGLGVPDPAPTGALTPGDALVFAGFVTVADWIGSNEGHFRHTGRLAAAPTPLSLADYAALAAQRAVQALREVRMDPFLGAAGGRTRRTFGELFPGKEPRDVQRAVIKLADRLTGSALIILEAPMGEGKTEAALYLADAWAAAHGRQGMYIALPTQATSNQMLLRVQRYLDRRFGARFANADYVALHLVYGEAQLNEGYSRLRERGHAALTVAQSAATGQPEVAMAEAGAAAGASEKTPQHVQDAPDEMALLEDEGPVYDESGQDGGEEGKVVAVEWFVAPKRALLAPFGVGTIDQALLGVLQTKHFFVRLFGLAGKTVILDEVHAYDTYMSTLIGRLLNWLGAFGVPVVLLSATLPREKRQHLQVAYAEYAGWSQTALEAGGSAGKAYPRLTWVSAEGADACEVAASADMSQPVELDWLDGSAPDSEGGLAILGERLRAALAEGGCVAVICNTVGRAQNVFAALKQCFPGQDERDGLPELDLFHARFTRDVRTEIETRVLQRFGRGEGTRRPRRAVLVATQVIEQSLDLDFDLMVSDLAPVDLLLQRCGRLHRHREHDEQRPTAVASRRLLIPRPLERDGRPQFPTSDEFIYDAHYLLRTWLALQGRTQIQMPQEIEQLVERVYDPRETCPADAPPAVRDVWEQTCRDHVRDEQHDLDEARVRVVPSPKDETVYRGPNRALSDPDEQPEADDTALALTRLGPPSVRVVLLPANEAERQRKAKGGPPNSKVTRGLLGRSVQIAHQAVAPALIEEEPPTYWKKSPWLRHARLVALNDAGEASILVRSKKGASTYTLRLDHELGVVIQRQQPNRAEDV